MQIIESHTGPAITLASEETLSRAFLIHVLNENGQLLPAAASDWLDVLFESLEEHDGEDLATDQESSS
jgi:hypothetical protein